MWSEEFDLDLGDENIPSEKKESDYCLITKDILNILNKDFLASSQILLTTLIKEAFRD